MQFSQLSLMPPLQRAVREAGYITPTPIQQKAIPPALRGRDLMGCAQTGTGKTAAFALPILQRLKERGSFRTPRALILTPTRELALQIGESFETYGKYTNLRCAVVFGGVGQAPQAELLKKGLDVLVACPGRLNDLIGQGLVDLSALEVFVLDEADRMLDMGFIHDVKRVIRVLPPRRQNLMFSATMPEEIEKLAASLLQDPVFVKVDPVSSTVDKIEQKIYYVAKADKRRLLIWLLQNQNIKNALVFSRTKHGADRAAKELNRAGITAAAIHGNKSQSARVAALESFKSGQIRVLVATDIAARGIDIGGLSHVINLDLPEVAETYVHRIGRTARAGAEGYAVSFCCEEEKEYLRDIEKLNRKKIPVAAEHPFTADAALPETGKKALTIGPQKNTASQEAGSSQKIAPLQEAENEETIVEEQKNAPQGERSGRSRHRHRRHLSAAAKAARAEAKAAAEAKTQQSAPAGKPAHEEKKEHQPKLKPVVKAPVQKESREQPVKPAEKPAPKKELQKEMPVEERSAEKTVQHSEQPQAKKQQEEDLGLILISRRPPAVKYANFEEYLKAHTEGGEAKR